jgi:hypothetical protein
MANDTTTNLLAVVEMLRRTTGAGSFCFVITDHDITNLRWTDLSESENLPFLNHNSLVCLMLRISSSTKVRIDLMCDMQLL